MTNLIRPRRHLQLLSLSGGGYKIVFAAKLLQTLEQQRFDNRFVNACDAFVGTSAGAILAVALAKDEMSLGAILDLLKEMGQKVFPGRACGPGLFRAKYKPEKLEQMLKKIFGEKTTFKHLKKPCFVSAVDVETGNTLLVGGSEKTNLFFDETPLWEAVLASVSAPTYFPFRRFDFPMGDMENSETNGWLIDGGIAANAPELLAAADISRNIGIDIDDILIMSIGTTTNNWAVECNEKKKIMNWGVWDWLIRRKKSRLIDIMMSSQVRMAERLSKAMLKKGNYIRVDRKLPFEERKEMDDYTQFETLCRIGEEYGIEVMSRKDEETARIALFLNRSVVPIQCIPSK